MARALRTAPLQGFARLKSVTSPVRLAGNSSEGELSEAVQAIYRQLLNRIPFTSERLVAAESQLRDGRLSVAEFVAQVSGSDLFQQRLSRMAPLKAASAAYLALLGRAATPAEVSRFLSMRATSGQQAALDQLIEGEEYASSFGENTVPYLRGLATADGIPIATVNRTASLYGGNAGLTPAPRGAI